MLHRFRKVSDNLYRGSAPASEEVIWLNKKLGITRIISLDEISGKKINLVCTLLKINHINLPIDIAKKSTLIRFLLEIGKLFKSPEKTFLHCKWGKDRSSLACAIYRCQEQGWSAEEAIKEARSLGFGIGLDPEIDHLYVSLIEDSDKSKDINTAYDIVDNSRNESYDSYYAGSIQNKSWSPYADRNVNIWPAPSESLSDPERNPLGGFGPSIVGDGTTL